MSTATKINQGVVLSKLTLASEPACAGPYHISNLEVRLISASTLMVAHHFGCLKCKSTSGAAYFSNINSLMEFVENLITTVASTDTVVSTHRGTDELFAGLAVVLDALGPFTT